MKLAVIADVHGNFEALCAVLADLSQRRPDIIINLCDRFWTVAANRNGGACSDLTEASFRCP